MEKEFTFRATIPKGFSEHNILGADSRIIITGYIDHPSDKSLSIRAILSIPFYDERQAIEIRKSLENA